MVPMINTKKADRRELKFGSLADLSAELDRIQHAHDAGTLSTTGNWSPGQNLQHCARLWRFAIDGFPPEANPPAPVRWVATLLFKKRAVSGAVPPAGLRLPEKTPFLPDRGEVPFEQGMREFRDQIARTLHGEQFTAVSPIFGAMTHDQWLNLQMGHCQLHLGFLQVGD